MAEVVVEVVQIMSATGWYFKAYLEGNYPPEWQPVACFALIKTRTTAAKSLQFSGTATRIIPLSPFYAFDGTDLIGKDVPGDIEIKYRPSSSEFTMALAAYGIA